MEVTKEVVNAKGDSISYYDGVGLLSMLNLKGFNNKALEGENFLNVHWLKVNLKNKIKAIDEAVELLAKELNHEPVPYGNQFQYCLIKKLEGDKIVHEKATKEFIDKKRLLEDVQLDGFKFKFFSVDDFRKWVDNVDCQFEIAEYLLKTEVG